MVEMLFDKQIDAQLGDDSRGNDAREELIGITMSTISFGFNSAFSTVSSDTGAFQKEAQDEMAKKVRGHIMAQPSGDGIVGMNVARYGMEVDYVDRVTDFYKVVAAVKDGIAWAVESVEGAFPLRGDKTVEVITETKAPQPPDRVSVMAILPTNLYVYPTGGSSEAFQALHDEIAEGLLVFDNIRDYRIHINAIELAVDKSLSDVELVKNHIAWLIKRYVDDRTSKFMPFVGTMPEIKWRVTEYSR